MTTDQHLLETARAFVEAHVEHARLVAIPFLDRPDTAPAREAELEAYRSFAFARGFLEGDRVSVWGGVSLTNYGRPPADVVAINAKTVRVRLCRAGDPVFLIDPTDLRHNYHELLEHARRIVANDVGIEPEEPIVVIPCSSLKSVEPAPAAEFYVGPYFRAMLAAARTLTTEDSIFVLSGKHGFVSLSTELEPYEQRIDEPGAVTAEALRRDVFLAPPLSAVRRGERRAVILAGSAYVSAALEAFGPEAHVTLPFTGARGIGDHLGRAKAIREGELELEEPKTLPCGCPVQIVADEGHQEGCPAVEQAAVAREVLEAAKTVGAAGSSDRWSKAVERYLEVIGYRTGDRAYVSTSFERGEPGDPRFGKVANIVGHGAGTMAGQYLVRFDEADPESAPTIVPPRWLRPIVAELLTAAGEVVDELEEVGR